MTTNPFKAIREYAEKDKGFADFEKLMSKAADAVKAVFTRKVYNNGDGKDTLESVMLDHMSTTEKKMFYMMVANFAAPGGMKLMLQTLKDGFTNNPKNMEEFIKKECVTGLVYNEHGEGLSGVHYKGGLKARCEILQEKQEDNLTIGYEGRGIDTPEGEKWICLVSKTPKSGLEFNIHGQKLKGRALFIGMDKDNKERSLTEGEMVDIDCFFKGVK